MGYCLRFISCVAAVPVTCKPTDYSVQPHVCRNSSANAQIES